MTKAMDTTQASSPLSEEAFDDRINDLIVRLENSVKECKFIAAELKLLKKEHAKLEKKVAGSSSRKQKLTAKDPNAPKKTPSGFAKPTQISAELAAFLGVSEGELIARPDVTRGITRYVKEHDLQKAENKRIIDLTKPGGESLIELLNVPDGQELTFFNLQKYLKVHFPNTGKSKENTAVKENKATTTSTATKVKRRAE